MENHFQNIVVCMVNCLKMVTEKEKERHVNRASDINKPQGSVAAACAHHYSSAVLSANSCLVL